MVMIGILFLAIGGVTLWLASRTYHELKKYEFENRTSAGVVQFDSYEDSVRHDRRMRSVMATRTRGGYLVAIGLAFLCFNFAFRMFAH